MPPNVMPRQVTRIQDAVAAEAVSQPLFKRQLEPSSRQWLAMLERYIQQLHKLFELRSQIVDVHPLLQKLYPVAIVINDHFYIFDVDATGQAYTFVKQAPTPMPVPKGVRAAFPLECYGGKSVCVVTDDVFDTLDGYVTIFHEFVHCYQWETCEGRLKDTLSIAQKAKAENDFLWEINYPFPYSSTEFVEAYTALLMLVDGVALHNSRRPLEACRSRLRQILAAGDFEYMVWQEWKEGFARYIENRISAKLGLAENHSGAEAPFDRVVFYEGGARMIAYFEQLLSIPELDIEILFNRMISKGKVQKPCFLA
jgi:hypothetical protein